MNELGPAPEKANHRLALVAEVLRSFADATTDYPLLLETIATRTAELLGHHCSIRLLSEDGTQLEPAAKFDPLEGRGVASLAPLADRPYAVAGSPSMCEALATGKAILLERTPTGPIARPFDPGAAALATSLGIESVIIAPLSARGQTYGAFVIVRRGSTSTLASDDLELAHALATHAALAISNARMLRQLTQEVDHRERAQSSLAAVEVARQYEKSIVDTIPHPLLVLAADRRVRGANRAFYGLFRTSEEEVIGQLVTEIASGALGGVQMLELLAEVLPVRPDASVSDREIHVETPALGRRTMLVNARKMYRPGNGTDTLLLALDDVSERMDSAGKLRQRALLLESMSDAVIAGDLDFHIGEWNPAAERLFGWPAAEVLGRPLQEVLPVQGVDRESARRDVREGRVVNRHIRVRHRSGRWLDIEISTVPVIAAGATTGFVSVMHDVTERLRMEREGLQRVHDLQVANRELESFSYSVSHDLRAPVRAIAGFARLLDEDYGEALDAEGLRLLRVVRRNAQRMGLLIDDLLAFARTGRQAITLEDVDMEALAREAAEDACRAEPGRSYDVRVGSLPRAAADKGLFAQVWQNLLANAIKYSRGRSPAVIEVSGETNESELVYRVRDNGVGFDMRHATKLFGVFERLHANSEFEGTGVGLALVDRIVRRHGGRVWADAAPDQGATFFFSMPKGAIRE